MGETNCMYHTDHHTRIKKLEDKTIDLDKKDDELEARFIESDKKSGIMQERITIALESLMRLPDAIDALKESNTNLQNKVENLEKNVTSDIESVKKDVAATQERLCNVDDKSKVDFLVWAQQNWIALAIGVAWVIKESATWINNLIK